jgi:ABC-2 type transport system permease protein
MSSQKVEGASVKKGQRYYPLLELTVARMKEFWREPEAIFWVFVFPVLLAWALGIAFRNQPQEKVRVAILDGSPEAAWAMMHLKASSDVEPLLVGENEAAQMLRLGKVDLIVGVSQNRSAPVQSGEEGRSPEQYVFTYRYDPARPNSRITRYVVDNDLQRALGRQDVAQTGDEVFSEPGGRYIDFLIPGLLAMNLMSSGMWGVGFVVVTQRMRKLLKRFVATPMSRFDYLVSFMLSRLIFLALELVALMAFAWFVFDVRIYGSIIALAVLSLLGAVVFNGLGLLVASRPTTTEGVSGWMNLVMMPMYILSGGFFSYEKFPEIFHPLIRALPLTALTDAMRAVINQGQPLLNCWPELLVLLVWSVVSYAVALRIFRWQ